MVIQINWGGGERKGLTFGVKVFGGENWVCGGFRGGFWNYGGGNLLGVFWELKCFVFSIPRGLQERRWDRIKGSAIKADGTEKM